MTEYEIQEAYEYILDEFDYWCEEGYDTWLGLDVGVA